MEPLGSLGAIRGSEGPLCAAASETVAVLPGEAIDELARDARNLAAALELYCGLIEEPGVLAGPGLRYGGELRQVAAACRRIVEKVEALDPVAVPQSATGRGDREDAAAERLAQAKPMDLLPAERIGNLAEEVESKRNLLAALAGPSIALTLDVRGGALPVNLTRGDLTRMLVSLVKNAVEAMPAGGWIGVNLDGFHASCGEAAWLVLTVEDSGPGFSPAALERYAAPRFLARHGTLDGGRLGSRRAPGLEICRAIVEAAGGRIYAANRPFAGARVGIELPAAGP